MSFMIQNSPVPVVSVVNFVFCLKITSLETHTRLSRLQRKHLERWYKKLHSRSALHTPCIMVSCILQNLNWALDSFNYMCVASLCTYLLSIFSLTRHSALNLHSLFSVLLVHTLYKEHKLNKPKKKQNKQLLL